MAARTRIVGGWIRDAGLLGALVVAIVLVAHHVGGPHPRWAEALGIVLTVVGGFAARRQHPFAVLVVAAAVAFIEPNNAAFALPALLATANIAYRRGVAQIGAAAAVTAFACLGGPAAAGDPIPTAMVVWHLVSIALAVAGGMYLSARRANLESLRERADQAEREQRLLTDQAVAAERVRIARELHDVVAHGVSLMVVQAQALGALGGTERDAAGELIAVIGREALTEMHRMLDVLRPQGDEAPERSPAPGVGDVPGLVERARGAGIDVALMIEGEPRALPAGADLSAYRIVQEALTNVVKHTRALRTEVRLRYGADELELSVLDDGQAAIVPGHPGHGLVGMRERVALFGGTLETGRRTDGPGYAVRAVLPL